MAALFYLNATFHSICGCTIIYPTFNTEEHLNSFQIFKKQCYGTACACVCDMCVCVCLCMCAFICESIRIDFKT